MPANKSRIPRLDGSMLIEIVKAGVLESANKASTTSGQKTSTTSRDSFIVSLSPYTNSRAQLFARIQKNTRVPISISMPMFGENGDPLNLPGGYGWLVYDSNRILYYTNSDFTAFVQKGGFTTNNDLPISEQSFLRYESVSNTWYTSAFVYGRVSRSTDGTKTWGTYGPVADNSLVDFVRPSGSTTFYTLSRQSLFKSTDNGESWGQVLYTSPGVHATTVLYKNGTIIVTGVNNILWTSTNEGSTWTNILETASFVSAGVNTGVYLHNVLVVNNQFWLIGYTHDNMKTFRATSTDGITWVITILAQTWSPHNVVRNPVTGLLVANAATPIGDAGSGLRWSSDNGLTWTNGTGSVVGKRLLGGTLNTRFNSLKFDGIRYIAFLGDPYGIHTSRDGKEWTEVTARSPSGGVLLGFAARYTDFDKNIM